MQMKNVLHVFLIHAFTSDGRISPPNVEKFISVISLSQVSQRLWTTLIPLLHLHLLAR